MNGYIYKITNTINGKAYIGWSEKPSRRFNNHRSADGSCPLLHKAIKKYGTHNFKFEVLCEDQLEKEDYYIQSHNTMVPNGYNLRQGGYAPPVGIYRTDTMKAASRDGTQRALKGKTYEEIHGVEEAARLKEIRRLSGGKNKGQKRKFTQEHCDNLSRAAKLNPSRGMLNKKHKDSTRSLQSQWANTKIRVVSRWNERLWVEKTDWRCEHPDWRRGLKWKDK